MKIIPVSGNFKDHSETVVTAIWEVRDFPLPYNIRTETIGMYNQSGYMKNARRVYENRKEMYLDKITSGWISEHGKDLGLRLKGQKDYILDPIWPNNMEDFDYEFGTGKCLLDTKGHQMNYHIDNRNVGGVFILNLKNNPVSTTFKLSKDGDIFYTAPKEKGTGVFFLNTHMSYHAIENDSDEERLIWYEIVSIKEFAKWS